MILKQDSSKKGQIWTGANLKRDKPRNDNSEKENSEKETSEKGKLDKSSLKNDTTEKQKETTENDNP